MDPVQLAQRQQRVKNAFNNLSIEKLQALAPEFTESEMAIKMQIMRERIFDKKAQMVARALSSGDVVEINKLRLLYGEEEFAELEKFNKNLEADRKKSRLAYAMNEGNTAKLLKLSHEYSAEEFATLMTTLETKIRDKKRDKLFHILENGSPAEIEKARKTLGDLDFNQFSMNFQAKKAKNNANAAAHNIGAKAFVGRYIDVPFNSEQKVGTKVQSLEARKRAINAQIARAFENSNKSHHGGPRLVRSPSEEYADASALSSVPLEVVVTKFKGRDANGKYLYEVADFSRFQKFQRGGTRKSNKQKKRKTRRM